MKGKTVTLPVACTGPADELWRVDLVHDDGSSGYVDNVQRRHAEQFLQMWLKQNPGEVVSFCSRCPDGPVACDCGQGVVFRFVEITKARIMPMREVV